MKAGRIIFFAYLGYLPCALAADGRLWVTLAAAVLAVAVMACALWQQRRKLRG